MSSVCLCLCLQFLGVPWHSHTPRCSVTNSRSLQDLNGDLEQCNYINYTSIKKFRNGIFTNTSFENFMALSPEPQYPTVEDDVVVVVVIAVS